MGLGLDKTLPPRPEMFTQLLGEDEKSEVLSMLRLLKEASTELIAESP